MFKKIFFGVLAVAIVCSIAASGYRFGKYLAKADAGNGAGESVQRAANG